MTLEQYLSDVKKMLDAATPGPWMQTFHRAHQQTPQSFDTPVWTVSASGPVHHEDPDLNKAFSDMKLISKAPTTIATLLEIIKIQSKVLDKNKIEWEKVAQAPKHIVAYQMIMSAQDQVLKLINDTKGE